MNIFLILLFSVNWESYTNARFVYDMVEDGGHIWCATNGGLAEFSIKDSAFIRVFTNVDGLPINRMKCLAMDGKGNLWLGSGGGGLVIFNPSSKEVCQYPIERIPERDIIDIKVRGDTIFVATSSGLYVLDDNATPLKPWDDEDTLLSIKGIICLEIGEDIWIGTDHGVSRVDKNLRVEEYGSEQGIPGDRVTSIAIKGSKVYVASDSGIGVYNGMGFDTLSLFSSYILKYHGKVEDMLWVDDTLYVGTTVGLYKWFNNVWKSLFPNDIEPGWVDKIMCLLYKDKTLWFGTGIVWVYLYGPSADYTAYGLWRYKDENFTQYCPPGPFSNHITDIGVDLLGNLWLCHHIFNSAVGVSYLKGEKWYQPRFPKSSGARRCVVDEKNRIWFGCFLGDTGVVVYDPQVDTFATYVREGLKNVVGALGVNRGVVWVYYWLDGLLRAFDMKNWFSFPTPTSGGVDMDFDSEGRVWVATSSGLLMFNCSNTLEDERDDTLKVFTYEKDNLPSNLISSVSIDPEDRIWIGTEKGLGLLEDGELKTIYTKENTSGGLLSNVIVKIRADGFGNVWILTDKGLSLFKPYRKKWESFTSSNSGLIPDGDYADYLSLYVDDERGRVWVGTSQGLSLLNYQVPPKTNLESVVVYPNPVIGRERVIFEGIPQNARIRIYTLAGEFIEELRIDKVRGMAYWEPKDRASGLYLAVVTFKGERRIEKIAVVK